MFQESQFWLTDIAIYREIATLINKIYLAKQKNEIIVLTNRKKMFHFCKVLSLFVALDHRLGNRK